MKYRFKDRALQEKLDAITDNRFSKSVEKSADHISLRNDYCEDFVLFGIGVIRIRLYGQAFEEIPEYDPAAWNEWPNAEPPHNVLMRVEIFPKEGYLSDRMIPLSDNAYAHRILTADRWVGWWQLTEDMKLDTKRIERLRYKPWEFEE